MFFKILVLLAVAAGLVYLIRQPRRGQAAGATPRRRAASRLRGAVRRRRAVAAGFADERGAVDGRGGGGVTGGGYRGQADYLLPVAGCLRWPWPAR